jgi:hypothetical protein
MRGRGEAESRQFPRVSERRRLISLTNFHNCLHCDANYRDVIGEFRAPAVAK